MSTAESNVSKGSDDSGASRLFGQIFHAVLPAALLAIAVGQIYAFTIFSDDIAARIGSSKSQVQFAFSLGIFFLGMGAAFFGRIVEKNIKLSTAIGTVLFLAGLCTTACAVKSRSLALLYLGYGFLVGTGTGVIYISPVKTMMLWFERHKAVAAAIPIISFGLGSSVCKLLHTALAPHCPVPADFVPEGVKCSVDTVRMFLLLAAAYAGPMVLGNLLLRKPRTALAAAAARSSGFRYAAILRQKYFLRCWLFMFLNISCGLCLIPLAKQMMNDPSVGYSKGLIDWIIVLCGLMNGGGRFLFAWWSDRLARRINIMLVILGISAGIMTASFWPPVIGFALLVINACYGAGFSVIPAILSDHYGMTDISKIHGAVLSAWGVAGIVGNQAAILVSDKLGFGYYGVVTMLVVFYSLNILNVLALRKVR